MTTLSSWPMELGAPSHPSVRGHEEEGAENQPTPSAIELLRSAGFRNPIATFPQLSEDDGGLEPSIGTMKRLVTSSETAIKALTTFESAYEAGGARKDLLRPLNIDDRWAEHLVASSFLSYDGLLHTICRQAVHNANGDAPWQEVRPLSSRQLLARIADDDLANLPSITFSEQKRGAVLEIDSSSLDDVVQILRRTYGEDLEFHGTERDAAISILSSKIRPGVVRNELSRSPAIYVSKSEKEAIARAREKFFLSETALVVFAPAVEPRPFRTHEFDTSPASIASCRSLIHAAFITRDFTSIDARILEADILIGPTCHNPRKIPPSLIEFFDAQQICYASTAAQKELKKRMLPYVLSVK